MSVATRGGTRRWLMLGALLLGLLLLLCTCNGSQRIQADLTERGQLELQEAGIDPGLLSLSGRDATLSGVVPAEAVREQALGLVGNVPGVRVVNDALSVEAVQEALQGEPALVLDASADEVILSGTVPPDAREQLVAAASEVYGANNVTDSLQSGADVAEPVWLAGLLSALPALRDQTDPVTGTRLSAQGTTLTVDGVVPSEEARTGLGDLLAEAAGLEVENNLTVDPELALTAPGGFSTGEDVTDPDAEVDAAAPDVDADPDAADLDAALPDATDPDAAADADPASLELQVRPDSLALSGQVDAPTQESLVGAANDLVGADNVTDNLSVAEVATPSWASGLSALLPGLSQSATDLNANGFALGAEGDTLTLSGTVPSEDARTALGAQVEEALAPDVQVVNELTVDADIAADAEAPEEQETDTSADANAAAETPDVDETPATESDDAGTDNAGTDDTEAGGTGADAETPNETPEAETPDEAEDGTEASGEPTTEPAAEPELRVSVGEDGVRLSGNVAQASEDEAVSAAEALPLELTNDLEVVEGVAAPPWLPNLLGTLPALNDAVQNAELDVSGDTVTLSGAVGSEDERAAAEADVRAAAGPDVTIINDLSVVEADAEATEDAVAETPDTDQADSEAEAEPEGAEAALPADVDAESPDAEASPNENSDAATSDTEDTEADAAAPAEDAGAEDAGADDTDTDTADTEPDAEAPDAEEAAADTGGEPAGLPDPNDIEEAADAAEEDGVAAVAPDATEASGLRAPELRVAVLGDTVQLSGTVADEEARQTVLAAFADKTVEDNLQVSSDVAQAEWLPALAELSPSFGDEVSRAVLEAEDGVLTLRGTVESDDARAALGEDAGSRVSELRIDNRLEVQPPIPFSEDGK